MLQTTLKSAALLFKSAVACRALKRESFTVAPQSQHSPLQNFNILYFSVAFTIPQWIGCKLAEQGRCKQESGNSNFFSSPSLPPDFGTVGVGFSLKWQCSQLSSLIRRLVLTEHCSLSTTQLLTHWCSLHPHHAPDPHAPAAAINQLLVWVLKKE